MNEEKTIRNVISKGDREWVVNYKAQCGEMKIVAVISKTAFGCRAALFKAGSAEPCVTMETSFGFSGTWRVCRMSIKGLMAKIGKKQRDRARRAARKAAAGEVEVNEAKAKEVAA